MLLLSSWMKLLQLASGSASWIVTVLPLLAMAATPAAAVA